MVDSKIYPQWLDFATDKFIPLVRSYSEFERVTFSKVLSATVEEHYVFSLLIELPDLGGYHLFQNEIMPQYIEFASPLFGTKTTHFVSLMKKI